MPHFLDRVADRDVGSVPQDASTKKPKRGGKLFMNIKVILTILIGAALIAAGCSKATTTTTTKTAANSNASVAKVGEKKTLPAAKVVPVPANWIAMADEQKGYGFKVPEGTSHKTENSDGMDVFMATTPEPSSVAVFVMAFKDKSLTKDDLLQFASKFLEGMEEKNIKIGDLTELSDDYSVATNSSVESKGKTSKGKYVVRT